MVNIRYFVLGIMTIISLDHLVEGERVECFCSDADCLKRNITWCYTSVACYSQWLDRRDGSPPLTRGCIMSGHSSSLLCLNQRPNLNQSSSWPSLVCCNTNRCNDQNGTTSIVPTSMAILIEQKETPSTEAAESDYNTMLATEPSAENLALSKLGAKLIEELKEKLANKEARERISQNSLEFRRLFVAGLGIAFTFAVSGFAVFCVFRHVILRDFKLQYSVSTESSSQEKSFPSAKYSNISSIPLTLV